MTDIHNVLLSALPEWAVLWVYPIAAISALVLLSLIFRKLIPSESLYDSDTDVVDTATQNSISAAYVIMGFTLVLVMGTADSYDTNIMTEATQIESLDRLLLLDASKPAANMRQDLLAYANSIVYDEWPNLGISSNNRTSDLMKSLSNNLQYLDPTSSQQKLIYTDIVRKTDQVILSREIRLLNANGGLPQLFWTISYLYLFCVVIICALRLSHATTTRVIAIGTQLTMLSLIFSAVMIIDHPYAGKTKVSEAPIVKAIEAIKSR